MYRISFVTSGGVSGRRVVRPPISSKGKETSDFSTQVNLLDTMVQNKATLILLCVSYNCFNGLRVFNGTLGTGVDIAVQPLHC
jgi:hypothetical protein